MAHRIADDVDRGQLLRMVFDDTPVSAYPGETIAAALLAAGIARFGTGLDGSPRGPVCNMGVCFECVVDVCHRDGGDRFVRYRACMTTVKDGMILRSVDNECRAHTDTA